MTAVERAFLDEIRYGDRGAEPIMWRPFAREIIRAHAAVKQARKVAAHTNDSDIRLCYCEAWLASVMALARSLP